jgi:hypothetical protein
MRQTDKQEPRIVSTYEIITPESAEDGEFASTGFENEDGDLIVPDEFDTKEDEEGNEIPLTVSELAVKYLQDHYISEPSSSCFYPGISYSTEHTIEDYSTGETESRSYHLKGFTEDQEREIYSALKYHRM